MKRLMLVIAPLMSVGFLTNCNKDEHHTYALLTQTENINVSSTVLDNSKDFYGTIRVNEGALFKLPEELTSINVDDGENTSISYACEYERTSYNEATLAIPKEAIVGNIDFELNLTDVYGLTTTNKDISLSLPILEKGVDYVGTITINDGVKDVMPDKLTSIKYVGGEDVPKGGYKFSRVDDKHAKLDIFKNSIIGNIEFSLALTKIFTIQTKTEHITISPSIATEGKKYNGTITFDRGVAGVILPGTLDSIEIIDSKTPITDYTYNRTSVDTATLEISGAQIKGNIDFELTLVPPPEIYDILTETEHITINPNTAIEGNKYSGKITPTDGYTLPENLDSIKVVDPETTIPITTGYTYKRNSAADEATLTIEKDYIIGNIDLELTLIPPPETYTIQTETQHITINPNTATEGVDYSGTITLSASAGDNILPEELDSVKIISPATDITNKCTYKRTSFTEATLTIEKDYIIGNIDLELTLVTPEKRKWYDRADWWNYCSNGVDGQQATEEDIGKVVTVTVNNLAHEVRLIDCDKDVISGSSPAKTAHCTFEFKNLITKDFNTGMTMYWNGNPDDHKTNSDYRLSTINGYLSGTIRGLLPSGLQNKLLNVDKKVGVTTNSWSTYTIETFSTNFFILSHDEMIEHTDAVAEGEGDLYEYYKTHSDYGKRPVNYDYADYYWMRSPYIENTKSAWCCDQSPWHETIYEIKNHVAPAFCI